MSTGKLAGYTFYPRDYMADTALLTLEEHGAYRLLLDYQWLQGSVPTTAGELARLWRVTPSTAARLWRLLAGKFPGGVNARMERERTKALARMERAIESGRLGAETKRKMQGAYKGGSMDPARDPDRDPSREPYASRVRVTDTNSQSGSRGGKPTVIGDLL